MFETKDYSDLSKVSLDKLYKLRDIAKDNCIEIQREYLEASNHLGLIEVEIYSRTVSKTELGG